MTNSRHNFNEIGRAKAKKREAPFSLRLTFEERAAIEEAANGVPMGAYIKAILFAEELPKVRRRSKGSVRDGEALGRVLAALGRSNLANNLNQLARAVNTGTLPVHPETEEEIKSACREVAQIRADLIEALGLDGGAR